MRSFAFGRKHLHQQAKGYMMKKKQLIKKILMQDVYSYVLPGCTVSKPNRPMQVMQMPRMAFKSPAKRKIFYIAF